MSKLSRWIILSISVALLVCVTFLTCVMFDAFSDVATEENVNAEIAFTVVSSAMFACEIIGTFLIWRSKKIPDITVGKPSK